MPGLAATADEDLKELFPDDEGEPEVSLPGDEADEAGDAAAEADADEGDEAAEGGDGGGDDGLLVTIGDEEPEPEPEAKAPDWVRDLRKQNREKDRRIRELERQMREREAAPVAAPPLGEKPKLPEFADADQIAAYERDLESWHERKRQHEDAKRQREDAEKRARDQWQQTLAGYEKAKGALKVADFADAEDTVRDTLNEVQQGIILAGLDKPELVVYALGKSPARLKQLAAITDPVKFAVAVAKVETQVKVQPRRSAPAPEQIPRSSGTSPASGNARLEKLRAKAEQTGDYTTYFLEKQRLKKRD